MKPRTYTVEVSIHFNQVVSVTATSPAEARRMVENGEIDFGVDSDADIDVMNVYPERNA